MRELGLCLLLLGAGISTLPAQTPPPLNLGITVVDGDKYNVEYQRFHRMAAVYRQQGIEAFLIDEQGLTGRRWSEEQLVAHFRPYHVLMLNTTCEGINKLTPEMIAQAKVTGAALARYVREGGGLFLQPRAVRYPGDPDEEYWNLVLQPLGCEILHEGVYDETRQYVGRTVSQAHFFYTTALEPHPVTAGVQCLYLPQHDYFPGPGVPAMRYSGDWQVIVKGEREAKSYQSGVPGNPNTLNLQTPGTYTASPPIAAVRTLGQGRIFCYPLSPLFTGLNHTNPLWPDTVETRGDPAAGRPSHSVRLQLNACQWLAEPARSVATLGSRQKDPYQPVTYPPSVNWDDQSFPPLDSLPRGIKAVCGVHTALTDGQGTVAEYVAAARAAGLSALVFTEPLELLTREEFSKLKADCAAASQSGDFYACPGIEFTDGLGTRWAFWGEKIVYPDERFVSPYDKQKTFPYWDGKRIVNYGKFAESCGFPPSAVIDYKQLRANGGHPENLWWFWHYFPLAYDGDKLIADNHSEFLFGLRDLRWSALNSFTRLKSPAQVAQAAQTLYTGFRDVPSAVKALNTRCAPYWAAAAACQYVSQGPRIVDWSALNSQMEENWRHTRGAHRVRLRLAVESDAGIAEVRIHDADEGLFRRYHAGGAKAFSRELEMVHDRQHYLTLEVVDTAGQRAFSHYLLIYCYKQGLFRCGDNLNILGATGMVWHPDRMELFPIGKMFHNAENYTLDGWDRGGALCPMPGGRQENFAYIKGVGPYPHPQTHNVMTGTLMDVGLSSYNVQIATMRLNHLAERFDTEQRPTPSMASLAKDLGENEYFERTHTIYAPEDRQDYYTIWNHRRRREGEQHYQGGVIWHEGQIRFKQDVTLGGSSVPFSLLYMDIPTDLEKNWGHSVVLTDADGTTHVGMLGGAEQKLRRTGRLRAGGYAAYMPSLVGYLGFFAPPGSDFCYSYSFPGRLYIGLGREGQEIKAGTVIPYRFAIATFATDQPGNALLEHHLKAFNFTGGTEGYPVKMKAGALTDATFFLTVAASEGEAALTVGPQKLLIDLPLRVTGLADNGCTAVYTSRRPWFRPVPVYRGAAIFQENIDRPLEVWVGNVFYCDQPQIKFTLITDGQAKEQSPVLEIHNPTAQAVTTTVHSPAQAPVFGGLKQEVTLPAGDSQRYAIAQKSLKQLP
jgi:hypothetical protein